MFKIIVVILPSHWRYRVQRNHSPVTRHRSITMTLKLLFKAEYFLLTLHRLSLSLSSGQCVHSQSKHKDPGEVDGSRSSDLPAFLRKIRRVVVRGAAVWDDVARQDALWRYSVNSLCVFHSEHHLFCTCKRKRWPVNSLSCFYIPLLSGKSNKEVLDLLSSGFRLPCPTRCPQNIYRIMMDCWAAEPSKRPSFHALHSQLDSIYARIYFKTIEV